MVFDFSEQSDCPFSGEKGFFCVSKENAPYDIKSLRGMRAPRKGSMAAEATALRRTSLPGQTLYFITINVPCRYGNERLYVLSAVI